MNNSKIKLLTTARTIVTAEPSHQSPSTIAAVAAAAAAAAAASPSPPSSWCSWPSSVSPSPAISINSATAVQRKKDFTEHVTTAVTYRSDRCLKCISPSRTTSFRQYSAQRKATHSLPPHYDYPISPYNSSCIPHHWGFIFTWPL